MVNSTDLKEFFDTSEQPEQTEPVDTFVARPEILLTGERPIPLTHIAPRDIKGDKWWNDKRKEVYASTNHRCLACGCHREHDGKRFIDEPLHAHELYRIDWKSKTMYLDEIVPLCVYCHNFIHQHGMVIRYDKGVNTIQDCWEAIEQGRRVCGGNIDNYNNILTYENSWNEWRFIFEGKEYFSKYSGYEEWREKEM